MLDIDAELYTNGGKTTDDDILAELREELFGEGKTDDTLEVNDKSYNSLDCLCESDNEVRDFVEKINIYAQGEISKRRRQSTINDFFSKL